MATALFPAVFFLRHWVSQSLLVPVVEVEEALSWVDTQKGGHIFIIGEGGTEANQSDVLLGHLNVSNGPGHQSF